MTPRHNVENLSQGALLILHMAYASTARRIISDPRAFPSIGLEYHVEDAAFEELRALTLLELGEVEGEIRPTETGWTLIDEIWPDGQLPRVGQGGVVVGSFDGQEELPVRLAVPVPELTDIIPTGSRLAGEASTQGLRFGAWELLVPRTDKAEDRILVQVVDGKGTVSEHACAEPGHEGVPVGPDTWLSVDRSGQCRDVRSSLEEILFLIAVGAA